jgi:hypothetical protein
MILYTSLQMCKDKNILENYINMILYNFGGSAKINKK